MKPKHPCPNCGQPSPLQGKSFYCRNCNLLFDGDTTAPEATPDDSNLHSEVKQVKTKLRVLGGLTVVSGIMFLAASTLTPIFIPIALFNLMLGVYLML